MLEKFFKDKRATKKHLEAPMLKERDEFLTFKLNQGRSQKRLLSIADYLLIIVEKLNLTDDDYRKVSIQEIEKAATEWSVYKMKRYKRHKPVPTAKKYFFEIAFDQSRCPAVRDTPSLRRRHQGRKHCLRPAPRHL